MDEWATQRSDVNGLFNELNEIRAELSELRDEQRATVIELKLVLRQMALTARYVRAIYHILLLAFWGALIAFVIWPYVSTLI